MTHTALQQQIDIGNMFATYTPDLTKIAAYWGVPRSERREVVTTVIDDVALAIFNGRARPTDMGRYLNGAMRNHLRNRLRAASRRPEVQLEFGLDVKAPADVSDGTEVRPEIAGLIVWLESNLKERDIAQLLDDSTTVVARVRKCRVRARVRGMLAAYIETLDARTARDVERFLRRAGVTPPPAHERGLEQ